MKYISIFLLLNFGLILSSSAQNRLYVSQTATGQNNGQSWADAFTDLHEALTTSQAGDEVWVATGTYKPTVSNDRALSFEPKSGIQLYGGFLGTETSLSQRNWNLNPTILSGDIGVMGDSTDNSYNVIYMVSPDSFTVVNGFTIRDGVADDQISNPFFRGKSGGGMYIQGENGAAYPEIRNCVFLHNSAANYGGGLMVYGGGSGSVSPRLINCRFESNNAVGGYGGGMARIGGSWVERGDDLAGCIFYKNKSGFRGGGFYYRDNERKDKLDIHGCTFEANSAVDDGGGAFITIGRQNPSGFSIIATQFIGNIADDGVAFISIPQGLNYANYVNIDSCLFELNKTNSNNSPQPAIMHTELFGVGKSSGYFKNCIFQKNQSLDIVTIDLNGFETFFEGNQIIHNTSGSATYFASSSNVNVKSCCFRENNGLSFITNQGAISKITYENCIFTKNSAINGAYIGIGNIDTFLLFNCTFADNNIQNIPQSADNFIAQIKNCILSDVNSAYEFVAGGGLISEFSNCFFDATNCVNFEPFFICGPGNIFNLDPQFRDPANGDYSLLPCSPLINAGSNQAATGILTDLAGNPRIQGGTVDIGAYESPGFTLASVPNIKPACVGASNGSISVEPVFGCEPYTYNWLPAAGNGPELNGLPPGNYLLTITDGSGRQILDTLSVSSAPRPELSPFSTDVQCSNGLGGSIASGIAGGTPPYHFEWLPAAADTSYLSALPPGNYALTVTDVHGCQDSATTSIALQGMISLMVDGQVIPCHGETGWLLATPVTGAAPYQWLWQGWPGTDSLAQPLGPGQYSVTVTDAYGCTASNTFPFLNDPSLLTASIDSDPQTDLSMPNGAAELTSVGGGSPAFPPLPPYQYNWNNGGMEAFIGGLTAGTYTVTITDKNGCTLALEVVVDLMVGTKDPTAQALLIYPNPATDWLRVVLPAQTGACTLELLDESGRVLRSLQLPNGAGMGQLDLQGLASGSYWVRVVEGELVVFGAFVKL